MNYYLQLKELNCFTLSLEERISPRMLFLFKRIFFALLLAAMASCNPLGKIEVKNIVNPDAIKPTISFITTAPATMNGAQDFPLEFKVVDDPGGSGISKAVLMYSPDGDNLPYREVGSFTGGQRTINFCAPNKNHPKPAFKIVATDNNGNSAEETLGLIPAENFSIALTEPVLPVLTSSNGLATNQPNTDILIDACKKTACSSGALYYETPTNNLSVAINVGQPIAASGAWVSCDTFLANGQNEVFGSGDGNYTYNVWVKSEDTDLDNVTPLTSITSTSQDITVSADITNPTATFVTTATAMNSLDDFNVSFNVSDGTSGISTAKMYYTPDSTDTATFPYVELGNITPGSPGNADFCVPQKTHPSGAFRIVATDAAGNSSTIDQVGFTVAKTSNPILPSIASASEASPITGGSSTVRIAACLQRSCNVGALSYEPADNNLFVQVATSQPAIGDGNWVSCATALANGIVYNFPTQVGSGYYNAASLWVKSEGLDLDGTTPVQVVSTSSTPISIPFDYTVPAITGTPFGDLSITGTSLLTGYSQGSFRLLPTCADPTYIPAEPTLSGALSFSAAGVDPTATVTGLSTLFTTELAVNDVIEVSNIRYRVASITNNTSMVVNKYQSTAVTEANSSFKKISAIAGTVNVSADNVNVTGIGTTFTTDFSNLDYTYINGVLTQIKTVVSDTQIVLNENPGNVPALVGNGLIPTTKIKPYGGMKITKGAGGAPAATDSGWQVCDSVNQTMLFDDFVNGVNNLQFWLKDVGDNVNSAFIPFAVTYNAPILNVENGPTISTEIADITINACGGGTHITNVLFNETGTQPLVTDPAWQTCSSAVGALKSMQLSPGNHTLKAFFKYDDNFISKNPVNVPVNYLPQVAWVETPIVNRPHTSYTLASCTGVDAVLVNQGAAPLAGDSGWQACSTTAGAITYTLTSSGSQTVNVWYKTGTTVSPDFSQVTVNFVPPTASIFGGSLVNNTQPPLSLDQCTGISKVYIKVDESSPTAPTAGDFAGAGGLTCTTALNGIIPPAVVGEGNHTYDVWYLYNDGYILDPWYSRVAITYKAPDVTPPPITVGEGAAVPLTLFLENGDGAGAVPGPVETIENNGSRASFTLNTCTPNPDIALTGTVSVTAASTAVTGVGTNFTGEISAGDFILISGESRKVKSVDSATALTLILPHTAGASAVAANKTFPEDVITGMIWKNVAHLAAAPTAPLASDSFWQACSSAVNGFKTESLVDGDYDLYAWFKDAAGNVSASSMMKNVIIAAAPDIIDPPRPPIELQNAPVLTSAPALVRVTDCTDIDQIYIETSQYPNPYVEPNPGLAGWQNCSTVYGPIVYDVDLAGSYTLSVWFKDAAGNINSLPRDIAFIFDPTIGNLPEPIAYWTMDKTHLNKNRVIDAKGTSHLYRWDLSQVTEVAGRSSEGLQFSGTNSYLFTENTSTLKPSISVTLSLWAYLTKSDAGTKGLATNGDYGLKLEAGNLKFFASGIANVVSIPTSSYETGWRHVVGTSDGRYLKLYLDGQQVSTTLDLGVAANLTYGCSKLFVVGGLNDACNNNPLSTNLFDNKIDEVVVWDQFFTDQMVLDHYIDAYNNFKVKQDSIAPADIAAATFQGEFMQNALITLPTCGDAKFIYINETTHPPTVDSPDWQLCNTQYAGIIHPNLTQGAHELKIWAKDEYNNISASYFKLDTTITGIAYQYPGTLYYTLDNNHLNINTLYDIFSGHFATNVGASSNQVAIQNEGFLFSRAESDFVERKYAYNAQPLNKITMSIWANLTSSDNRQQVLAGNHTTNHGYSFEINQANNELRFNVETSGGLRYAGIGTASYTTGFHNIIGSYDGQFVKIYMDGNEVASVDYTSTLGIQYSCLGSFMIGAESSCNNGPVAGTHFDNILDEIVVWDDALSSGTIYNFFNGQDTVPPVSVAITPKNNNYTTGIPIARFNVSSCTDVSAVYATLDTTVPLPDIANWQACATTGDLIKSPLLALGNNTVKFWFKDAAGNVSLTSTDVVMNFTYDFTIPTPDSYWTLNQVNVDGAVAFDVTGGKDGVLNGTLQVAAQVDEGRSFNGTSEFIEVPYNASFQPANLVTVSTWFKVGSFDAADHVLIGNSNGGGYSLVLGNNTLEFRVVVDSANEVISTSTVGLLTTDWHHAVGVYDNGTLRLFLDGTEVLPAVTVASLNKDITYTNNNSVIIGAASTATTGAAGSYFSGSLDEVSYFNAALTDTVVTAMYNRGIDHDLIYYNVTPPTVPGTLNITYYNSLVSRANLTVNSCTGLDYILVSKDEFPPDKNDIDWQKCNTLVGGLLSKELTTADSFGKLWTKDLFGNISKTFEYVPITTQYDLPISRPVVHWTFDNSHYLGASRTAYDRLSQINLKSDTLKNVEPDPVGTCRYIEGLDSNTSVLQTNQTGVLNQSFGFGIFNSSKQPTILRANHPANAKVKPTDKLSVAAWVYLVGSANTGGVDKHIVSNLFNGKGWAIRLQATNFDDRGLRFSVYTDQGLVEPYLETKNYTTGWHLVVGTFDGQKASLYFDGIFVKSFSTASPATITYEPSVNTFVGSAASTNDLPNNWKTYEINTPCGAMYPGPGAITSNSYYDQKIDEVIVWDKTIGGLEVSSLYHNGADILYAADTTPPVNPTVALENTRPNMFTNKAYFTVNSCTDISGVLVNEGTQPDKQDARWEICRLRLGSFGIESLTAGGHTVTTWFKDLAGNVTPVSSDFVVDYNNAAVPSANAVWPLDATQTVSKWTADIVDNKVHDLLLTNIDTPVNPTATHVAGKVNEGFMLGSANGNVGSYLTGTSTKLLRPVNYLSVGGWYYLTNADGATKVLIDHHNYASATSRTGYDLRLTGGNLVFKSELDIANTVVASTSMTGISTGWHHVLGVFTGYELKLFVDGVEVSSVGPLAERDYVRWDVPTPFRIGAESNYNTNPNAFFNEKVDEVAIYGFDLTQTQINSVVTAGNSGNHVYAALAAPANVDNAYIYHYDNFGPRARMTILDCTNTPYIFVQEQDAATPDPKDVDWRNCVTTKGAILSKELPLGTQFVDVYAKNADGVISTVAGRKEILPIVPEKKRLTGTVTIVPSQTALAGAGTLFTTELAPGDYVVIAGEVHAVQSITNDTNLVLSQAHTVGATGVAIDKAVDYNLTLPITYYSLNTDQITGTNHPDFFTRGNASETNAPVRVANADGGALQFNGTSNYVSTSTVAINDLRQEITIGIWAEITNGDATLKRIVNRYTDVNDTAILLEGGNLKFRVNVTQPSTFDRGTSYVDASYPTSLISTGMHFVTGIYDGYDVKLYLDAILVATTNVGYRNWAANGLRPIVQDQLNGFRLSYTTTGWYAGILDEFLLFDKALSEPEIVSWYKRYAWAITPADSTPPTTIPNIGVIASTFGANWPTDNPDPMYTVDDCTDIAGVYITIDGQAAPTAFDTGWQRCETLGGYLLGPTLSAGSHTVKFWFKDANGNVTPTSIDTTVVYSVPARPDTVAYWAIDDETVVGKKLYESVNQLDADMYGILPADFVAGKVNDSIKFDGSRKYLEVEHNSIIKPTDELSVSFWVNIIGDYTNQAERYILNNRGDTPEGFAFRWHCTSTCSPGNAATAQYFEFLLNLGGTDFTLDIPQAQIGGGWKHIVGTFDGRFMKLYINGALSRTKDTGSNRTIFYNPPAGNYPGTSLVMMAKASDTEKPSGSYYDGNIDEVAIYNTALYATHVTDIYTNFANNSTKIYDPSLAVITPPNARTVIYEPGKKSYGSRLRMTVSDCTDMNQVLVTESTVAPANNDENWQPCNTLAGGILSAPMTYSSTVTPVVWAKNFTGTVSASYGTANGQTYTFPNYVTDIPRPQVHWSLDSSFVNALVATTTKDSLSRADGVLDAVGVPTSTVTQAAGTVSISSASNAVTGVGTTFTTEFVVGDRIRIGNETLQIQSITNDTALVTETNHLGGATGSVYYKIGDFATGTLSAIEGGFNFDGVDDMISIHPTAATNPMYDISISAWVQLKKGETQHRHIVGNEQYFATASGGGAGLRIKNAQLQFYVTSSPSRVTYVAGIDTNIYSDGLHHIAGTYDGRDLNLFLDGVKVKTYSIQLFGTRVEIYHDDTSHWTIGAETGTNNAGVASSFYNGVIDDVRIWDKTLTEQQVYYDYEYGAFYLPTAVPDGIAPTDPGIYLSNGLTTSNMPWVNFTMPSCTGANGIEINAIYVKVGDATPPLKDDLGWQFCSLDAAYIISSLLDAGASNVYIFYRDEEGDVSAAPASTFSVTYYPPSMVNPQAYYTFNAADRVGSYYYKDLAGHKDIRSQSYVYDPIKVGGGIGGSDAFKHGIPSDNEYTYTINRTYRGEYDAVKDFAFSFWYKMNKAVGSNTSLMNQGQYDVVRTTADTITVLNYATKSRLKSGVWHNIAASRTGSTLKLYFDGRLDASYFVGNGNLALNGLPLVIGGAEGWYDEIALYDQGLSEEQMAYIYYHGAKNEYLDTPIPNYVESKIPDYYWNFNDANYADPYLNSLTGTLPMRRVGSVTPSQTGVDAKVAESFLFTRFEDVVIGGEANTVGVHQYLESDSAAPIAFGAEYTISLWTKQPSYAGHYNASGDTSSNDSTAILDMWGPDDENQVFRITYNRGASSATTHYYNFIQRVVVGGTGTHAVSATIDPLTADNTWVYLTVRRKGKVLNFFVNGIESGSLDTNNLNPLLVPNLTRLRFGESSLYSYYNIAGTVTVGAGSNAVVGTGTSFLTDLFETKTGTVDVTPGTSAVVGTGTSFLTEFAINQFVKINGEIHQIATITDATNMTLVTTHTGGAVGSSIFKRTTNTVRIGLQNFTITNIIDDTNLTLSANHTTGATGADFGVNISKTNAAASDEYAYNGLLDEVAIWKDRALSQREIYENMLKGNAGNPIPIDPVATLVGVNGATTWDTPTAKIQLNDCNGFSHVWVGFVGDAAPLDTAVGDATYPGWVACDPNTPLDSATLTLIQTYNLRLWFKTGVVVSSYTTDINIDRITGDTTPPTPPSVTKINAEPTTEAFAKFTIGSCADIDGVYVGVTASPPSGTQSGWQTCTTAAGAMLSPPLVNGVNNISVWFKDAASNVSASTDFVITYNEPAVPAPSLYLTMDNAQIITPSKFQREVMTNDLAQGVNTGTLAGGYTGIVNEAVNFSSNAYYDLAYSPLTLTNAITVSAWINITAPSLDSHIIGRWDETSANDSFAVRVDSIGRLCLDFQTTASTGTWNTNKYKRACSSNKVEFAVWQHIAVVRNAGLIQFYINNALAGSTSINTANFVASPIGVRVGAQIRGGKNSPVTGQLDEVAIWNSVLTADERSAVYAKGLKTTSLATESGAIDPAISPTHYWKFETGSELVDTIAGTPLHFDTNTGPATLETTGGQVLDYFLFTSTNSSVISRAAATSINFSGDFTMSVWVKPTTNTASDILGKWDTATPADQEFRLRTTAAGQVIFDFQTSTPTTSSISSIENLAVGVWSRITVARSGTALYLYINSKPQNVIDIGADPLIDTALVPLSLGGNAMNSSSYFNGAIDDLVIYQSYLQERKIYFNYDKGLIGDPVIP